MFCKRVRKPLIGKKLAECTFLKSAERFESKGFNFLHLGKKHAKSGAGKKGESKSQTPRGRAEQRLAEARHLQSEIPVCCERNMGDSNTVLATEYSVSV